MIVVGFEQASVRDTVGVLHAADDAGEVFRVVVESRFFAHIVGDLSQGCDIEIDPEPWQFLGKLAVKL